MKKNLQKIIATASISLVALLLTSQAVWAQSFEGLKNPVVGGEFASTPDQANSGESFGVFFINLWSAMIGIGAIFVLVLFIWGALEWIASGGDKGKIENARNRITQAIVGLVLLVGSFAIISFLSQIFFGDSFDILNISIPNALGK